MRSESFCAKTETKSRSQLGEAEKKPTVNDIPGHFFNIEHSPYLFPMFSFKKHRSMHVCNHVTKVTKISTWQFNKMVKLFEEEIHIMQLFYAN
jgi:hypothetical protein